MQFMNTLITFISQAFYVFAQSKFTVFKYTKIMLSTFTMSGADDLTIRLIYHYLGLQCTLFIFPTVELFLFF